MNQYKLAFPIPDNLMIGQSLTPIYTEVRTKLHQAGVTDRYLIRMTQYPLAGFENNVVLCTVSCTEEDLTMILLKTNALIIYE